MPALRESGPSVSSSPVARVTLLCGGVLLLVLSWRWVHHGFEPLGGLLAALGVAGILSALRSLRAGRRGRAPALPSQMTADLEAVFDALPDLVFLVDADGTILDGRGGSDLEYARPGQVVGGAMRDVLPASVGARFDAAVRRIRETRQPVTIEYVQPTPRGDDHYEARLLPLHGGRYVVVARNITEYVRADEALRQSQARLIEAEHAGKTARWYWDVGPDQVTCSEGMYRILGVDRHQLRPTYDGYLRRVHPDDDARIRDAVRRVF